MARICCPCVVLCWTGVPEKQLLCHSWFSMSSPYCTSKALDLFYTSHSAQTFHYLIVVILFFSQCSLLSLQNEKIASDRCSFVSVLCLLLLPALPVRRLSPWSVQSLARAALSASPARAPSSDSHVWVNSGHTDCWRD